jgi:adenosylcobinamide-GDP ribazoletransferase
VGGFLGAVSLLTRVPARGDASTEGTVPWFPVVGALVGAAVAGAYAVARTALGPLVSATLAIAAGILLTGALHEDGLADTADAFGAGVDRERTIDILKDPRHGTYGMLALALSVGARIFALGAVGVATAAAALPAAHALARGGAVAMMGLLPAAGADGLGATYARRLTRERALASAAAAAAAGLALLGLWALPAIAIVAAASLLVGRIAVGKIGGITGDVLGAAEQLSEIAVLLLASAVAPAVPWWSR